MNIQLFLVYTSHADHGKRISLRALNCYKLLYTKLETLDLYGTAGCYRISDTRAPVAHWSSMSSTVLIVKSDILRMV